MAFDDFLNKVKETSVNAMDKAKDTTKRMATINDLKGQIRSLNNEKNKLFTQMGMDIYVAKKEDKDITEALNAFVENIDIMNEKIKELQTKLALVETET